MKIQNIDKKLNKFVKDLNKFKKTTKSKSKSIFYYI